MITQQQKLRAARALLNMTQKQLAEAAGVGVNTIMAYEAGKTSPRGNNMRAIWKVVHDRGIRFSDAGVRYSKADVLIGKEPEPELKQIVEEYFEQKSDN